MIDISKNLKKTGGIIPAITLTCAEIMRQHITKSGMTMKRIDDPRIKRILTHANPHIDEYMAALILRAVLPVSKKLIPMDETYLSSHNNDVRARSSWPEAILLGFGGTHNGGARAAILLDEHTSDEQKAKDESVTQMVCSKYLEGRMSPALFHLIREVNHIDANGGAHDQNIGNYIKRVHGADVFSGFDVHGNVMNDRMDSAWKEACIYACITALLLGEADGLNYTSWKYWNEHARQDVTESLEFYREHSAYRDNPNFPEEYSRQLNFCTGDFAGRRKSDKNMLLTAKNDDGSRTALTDSKGNTLFQVMMMPYIASLCKRYWGEKLANIIMFSFWDTKIQQNLTRLECMRAIEGVLAKYPDCDVVNEPTPIGQVSILYSGHNVAYGGKEYPVVLIDVSSTIQARDAMLGVLNTKFGSIGYTLFRNQDKSSPSLVFSRGSKVPGEFWKLIVDELLARDGSSDSRRLLGKWHVVKDPNGNLGTFILNGNAAHKYVQKVARTASGFMRIIKNAHAKVQG